MPSQLESLIIPAGLRGNFLLLCERAAEAPGKKEITAKKQLFLWLLNNSCIIIQDIQKWNMLIISRFLTMHLPALNIGVISQ